MGDATESLLPSALAWGHLNPGTNAKNEQSTYFLVMQSWRAPTKRSEQHPQQDLPKDDGDIDGGPPSPCHE